LRLSALVLAITATSLVATATARADTSPQPGPSVQASALPGTRLDDAAIRTLLVGNSYTVDYREGKRLTIDVHPDGTLSGYVSEGMTTGFRMGGAAAREQDQGKYTIANGQYCWQFNGAWARKDGKPACAAITRADAGYILGSTRMTVTQGKK
jgi:hypothetical protein